MSALQMNDYPEENSGSQIAFLFSKPYECERLVAGQVYILTFPFLDAFIMPPIHAHAIMRFWGHILQWWPCKICESPAQSAMGYRAGRHNTR